MAQSSYRAAKMKDKKDTNEQTNWGQMHEEKKNRKMVLKLEI